MKSRKPKIVIIVGPTASGKSELAVILAKKFNGEIISADSQQVYRGLDIGTGKIAGRWSKNTFLYKDIPHYCIDYISPKRTFTVAEYKKCAETAIKDISHREKIPILVGGTGFWIDTLVYDLSIPEVPPNQNLRRKLERKSAQELLKILEKLDPRRARLIERQNPRRLIRAIEVARALGQVPELKKNSPYNILWIGLKPKDKILQSNIKRRILEMIQQGIAAETKKLFGQGISKKRIKEFGFEYRAVLDYLDKKISKDGLGKRLIKDSLEYVKKQMRWFKRNEKIRWLPRPNMAVSLVKKFI